MNTSSRLASRQLRFFVPILGSALLLPALCGCPTRTMRIVVDKYINTAPDKIGYPITVDIVSIFPHDLSGDLLKANEDLLPEKCITADMWFDRRPTWESMKEDNDYSRFRIPNDQIFSYAQKGKGTKDEDRWYGTIQGGQLVGSNHERGKREIKVEDIPIGSIFNSNAVIYVFCAFNTANGTIADTKPAIFHEVGDFKDELAVHIRSQSVVRTTKRSFGDDLDCESVAGSE